MKQKRVYFGITVLLAALVSGCAHRGPILLDFKYQSPKETTATAPKATIGLTSFKDDRGKTTSVIGSRFLTLNNQANDLVVQGTVSERVTAALKNALKARSMTVVDAASWDLTDAGIPSGADLVIGGEIKSLWVDATSQLANTAVKADVQLRIVVADTAQKKIIRVLNVNSKLERQTVASSFPFVERTLSEALTTAIDQIFTDEELKNKLK